MRAARVSAEFVTVPVGPRVCRHPGNLAIARDASGAARPECLARGAAAASRTVAMRASTRGVCAPCAAPRMRRPGGADVEGAHTRAAASSRAAFITSAAENRSAS
jgi:hypothetical protein